MSYEISPHKKFLVEAKRLKKWYRSFNDDLEDFKKSLQEYPFQGAELCPGIRKIRMAIASKGRGKSGGARVITANAIVAEHEGAHLPSRHLRQGRCFHRKAERHQENGS